MLARNFLSASSLGLTEDERNVLIQILGMMERGELIHVPVRDVAPVMPDKNNTPFTGHFNMRTVGAIQDCKTICCILGTAILLDRTVFHYATEERNPRLHALFFPQIGVQWNTISVPQAAQALSNYLTLGDPHWASIEGLAPTGLPPNA